MGYTLILRPLYGNVSPVHKSSNEGIEIKVVPLAMISSDSSEKLCGFYPCNFVSLEDLEYTEGSHSSGYSKRPIKLKDIATTRYFGIIVLEDH